MITYEEFKNVVLVTGVVQSAQPVSGSDKLLSLAVLVGTETRQIVAGIGKRYLSETLIGKTIIVVANLAPRSLMGVASNGMLLAADGGDGPVLLTTDSVVPSGSLVR